MHHNFHRLGLLQHSLVPISLLLYFGRRWIPLTAMTLRQIGEKIGKYRLDYPAHSDGKFNACFTYTVFILAVIGTVLITIVNVAGVGYELVPFISSSYNGSANLWYERFVPNRWTPVTRSCEASMFTLGQGCFDI